MIIDMLSASGFAADLIERTSDTPRVQMAVELSLAPAFLLVGIGSLMNVMMARLTWIAGRIERLSDSANEPIAPPQRREIDWLCMRRAHVRQAIKFSTGAAAVISVVVALLFLSVYIEQRIGTLVAVLWFLTIGLLITGLACFLRETLLAADDPREKH